MITTTVTDPNDRITLDLGDTITATSTATTLATTVVITSSTMTSTETATSTAGGPAPPPTGPQTNPPVVQGSYTSGVSNNVPPAVFGIWGKQGCRFR